MRIASALAATVLLGLAALNSANGQGGRGSPGEAEHSIPAGTPAPDGIGVVVAPARSMPTAASASTGKNNFMVDSSVIKPLPVDAKIPEHSVVKTFEGKPFDLNAAVASKPTILIFYRGGWCPYCNGHLHELQNSMASLKALGYQVLAVGTDTPEALRKTITSNKFDYQLLSDNTVEVAAKFGLRYKVTETYKAHAKEMGVDLDGTTGGYLVTPAAYVLDTKGTVRYVYANNNYSVRISQEALLKAAKEALKP